MSSISRVSDEEVSSVIRYLDPDLHDDLEDEVHRAEQQSGHRIKLVFLISSAAVILYLTALRYLPAVVRLLN
jgi:hypothetical protein